MPGDRLIGIIATLEVGIMIVQGREYEVTYAIGQYFVGREVPYV